MKQSKPSDNIEFKCGISMNNRFMLAPLTNQQSHEDGSLSEDELNWLSMRAKGGFGLVMTCASHIQQNGKGFEGQLGIFSDAQISGHKRLTDALRQQGSVSVIQLFHAGLRSPKELIGQSPVCPSNNEKYGARGLTKEEVSELKNNFIQAAVRAKKSGYDGVEIHGAHGYIICQFLSAKINQRTDEYGGNLENRSRLLFEIVKGIRELCGPSFLLGVRLSPERFGMDIGEIKWICKQLIRGGKIDFLDISLWDYNKFPEDEKYRDKNLLNHFTEIEYGEVRWTIAGKIRDGSDVSKVLESGVDFVTIGRSAILHHDFPRKVMSDEGFKSTETPVSESYLLGEGLSSRFVNYMNRWPGFVNTGK
ncbi:NADH:flavin oxidoreductase [Lutimonas saemankumensis]|uniref:NADH:flavin oxidoreductase n=1 Tax=Lutimonas saemankumensis TaxID=483016 RepID=UPI001CD7BE65|nr:NADH:flavin oxidoreductase [Lutimonas saemankumensis]MCA0931406.1 NADH:flavin oxidoreductase [Lutimonas saemankumensis]